MPNQRQRAAVVPPLIGIGLSIQRARRKRRMTVAKLSRITCVSSRYINDIELGNFASIPGRAYVMGFTRTLSRELGLDDAEILRILKSELYGTGRIGSDRPTQCRVGTRSIAAAFARILRLARPSGRPGLNH